MTSAVDKPAIVGASLGSIIAVDSLPNVVVAIASPNVALSLAKGATADLPLQISMDIASSK